MKTKALISFAVTAKLFCVFVFAYAKSRFSHDEARIIPMDSITKILTLRLTSVASHVGLSPTSWKTLEVSFLTMWLKYYLTFTGE